MTSREVSRIDDNLGGFVVRLLEIHRTVRELGTTGYVYAVSIEHGTAVCFSNEFDTQAAAWAAMDLAVVGLRLGLPKPDEDHGTESGG